MGLSLFASSAKSVFERIEEAAALVHTSNIL